jgi:hypothetical protein
MNRLPQTDPQTAPPARPTARIEVNTLKIPRIPVEPSPDDEDQTGVRAMLSSLPEPDPMPAYLVERISASLAAEQAQREDASGSVTPMLTPARRRPGRLVLAIAGAAAAVVLIGVVANDMLSTSQSTTASDTVASALTSGSREAGGASPPSANDKAVSGSVSTPAAIQIRMSDVRYTVTGFVTQARGLSGALFDSVQPNAAVSSKVGPIGTAAGLADCLSAIGADRAQMVWADLAFYQEAPAVIIVATTDGIPTGYVVGRECSRAQPALLRPATPLR